MIDFDELTLVLGMIIGIVGMIIVLINVIRIYKKIINEHKNKKLFLVGMGTFTLIYFIINHIKKVLLYG